jgi:hypothetical protein
MDVSEDVILSALSIMAISYVIGRHIGILSFADWPSYILDSEKTWINNGQSEPTVDIYPARLPVKG